MGLNEIPSNLKEDELDEIKVFEEELLVILSICDRDRLHNLEEHFSKFWIPGR